MDDVCWDNGKHDTDEEAGRGKTQRRAGGGAHIRAHGQGKRTGPDRARRTAQTVHQKRAGDGPGRGDDRAPGPRQAQEIQGRQGREHAQRHHRQDRGHRFGRSGRDRGAARPRWLVRAGRRQETAAAAARGGRGGAVPVCQGPDHRRDQRPLPGDLRGGRVQGDRQSHHRAGRGREGRMVLASPGSCVRGRVHRRDRRQGARRAGRQPRVLRGRWRGSGGRPRRPDAGQVGGEISRDPQAVDGRVGTVHTVPGL